MSRASELYGSFEGREIYVVRDSNNNIVVSDDLFELMVNAFAIVSKLKKTCDTCFTRECKGCLWNSKIRGCTKWNDSLIKKNEKEKNR